MKSEKPLLPIPGGWIDKGGEKFPGAGPHREATAPLRYRSDHHGWFLFYSTVHISAPV